MHLTMLDEDFFQWTGLIFMWISLIYWGWWVTKRLNRIENMFLEFKTVRRKLYEHFADHSVQLEEFERAANVREMLDADRDSLPRENAGAPAVIHKARVRRSRRGKGNSYGG